MTPRDIILGRIREALKIPARAPHHPNRETHQGPPSPTTARQWLPPVPPTLEGQIALFAENAATLKASFHRLPSRAAAASFLRQLAESQGWSSISSHWHPLCSALVEPLDLPVLWWDEGADKSELEKCPAGLTACEALIAQTGSILVSSKTCGGRNLSVLPPTHIVIATENQMCADLADALAAARAFHGGSWPSMLSLITGPSRTGDIERILVLGAHGPKQLFLLLIPE